MTINSLKKIIKYRLSYSGTKETDILYNNYFLKKLNYLDEEDLNLLVDLLDIYSDRDMYLILTNKKKPLKKFNKLFKKINIKQ